MKNLLHHGEGVFTRRITKSGNLASGGNINR